MRLDSSKFTTTTPPGCGGGAEVGNYPPGVPPKQGPRAEVSAPVPTTEGLIKVPSDPGARIADFRGREESVTVSPAAVQTPDEPTLGRSRGVAAVVITAPWVG